MKLGYVIAYVPDVMATVAFYEQAFGLQRKMVMGTEYAEMETGATVLAFVTEAMRERNGLSTLDNRPAPALPAGLEIALVTEDVSAAHSAATAAGAVEASAPAKKPWGQIVSYVRDINGILVELCSPMSSGDDSKPDSDRETHAGSEPAAETTATAHHATGTPSKRSRPAEDNVANTEGTE